MDELRLSAGLTTAHAPESAPRPRAVVVSNVVLYRQGLEASLGRDGRLSVVAVVSSREALPVVARQKPNIVLLDGTTPEGLTLARTLRAQIPAILLVGFGISGGTERLVDCAQNGFAAFVDSNASVTDLVDAAIGALRGELTCSPRVSALLCERLAFYATAEREPEALTRREREIAVLIGEGLSNKEIAKDLCIGPSTVKNHVHNILEKLKVRRRSAIAHQISAFRWADRDAGS
jgi:two-component system, NarL family, nitrate/nitrite response regulator NarL